MPFYKNIILQLISIVILICFTSELKNLRIIEENEDNEEKSYINPPKFSRISGFYPDNFKLKLLSEENYTIYYTLDSTDPRTSPNSKKYQDYILIYDKSSEPNIYSSIGTNDSSPVSISTSNYNVPNYPVDKAMIVRAVTQNSKGEFSEVISKTYFVTIDDLYKYQDLLVISLVTNPENLFDPDMGIYVTGTQYQEEKKKNAGNENKNDRRGGFRMPSNYRMRGKEWERESFITIFNKGEINVQQKIGIRIKGAASRNNPGKSFNIYARKKYGKKVIETDILKDNYDINGNLITSYKSLSLRNINDEERLRDKVGRDLFYMREGLTTSNMENAILFLNGEYWGLYLIQEKLDDSFISSNYLIPSDKVVLGKSNKYEDGPIEEFNKFNYFCGNYSLKKVSDEKIYSEIKNNIDIDSYIELYATGIYISNLDWPSNNDGEWKYYGDPIDGNKYTDGKWRFIIFDLDYSMGKNFINRPGSPEVNNFLVVEERGRSSAVRLFLNLIKNNTDFQNKFVNTICDYANNIYNLEIINKLIGKYREEYTDLVANSQLRWSKIEFSSIFEGYTYYKSYYYKALDSLIDFFEKRPGFMYQHMKEYMGLKGNLVDLTIEIKGKGKIQVNSILPKFNHGIWTGQYFSRIPINIKAIPNEGYIFKGWDGYIQSNQQKEKIILSDSSKIIAYFE